MNQSLIDAVLSENVEQVEQLLKAGADPNIETSIFVDSPELVKILVLACLNQDEEIVQLLLKYGADPNAMCIEENNIMILMDMLRYMNLNIMKMLINAGANIHAIDKEGNSVLYHAISGGLARYNKNIEIIHILINKGADINIAIQNIVNNNKLYNSPFEIIDKLLEHKNLSLSTIIAKYDTLTNTVQQQKLEIEKLQKENELLKNHIKFEPGGPGYHDAKQNFENNYHIRMT